MSIVRGPMKFKFEVRESYDRDLSLDDTEVINDNLRLQIGRVFTIFSEIEKQVSDLLEEIVKSEELGIDSWLQGLEFSNKISLFSFLNNSGKLVGADKRKECKNYIDILRRAASARNIIAHAQWCEVVGCKTNHGDLEEFITVVEGHSGKKVYYKLDEKTLEALAEDMCLAEVHFSSWMMVYATKEIRDSLIKTMKRVEEIGVDETYAESKRMYEDALKIANARQKESQP